MNSEQVLGNNLSVRLIIHCKKRNNVHTYYILDYYNGIQKESGAKSRNVGTFRSWQDIVNESVRK